MVWIGTCPSHFTHSKETIGDPFLYLSNCIELHVSSPCAALRRSGAPFLNLSWLLPVTKSVVSFWKVVWVDHSELGWSYVWVWNSFNFLSLFFATRALAHHKEANARAQCQSSAFWQTEQPTSSFRTWTWRNGATPIHSFCANLSRSFISAAFKNNTRM